MPPKRKVNPRDVATRKLLAQAIQALRLYRATRDRQYYESFREAKRGLYALWPEHRAGLLVRYAALRAGWETERTVKIG